ncbi:MAG: hypothetical protein QM617_03655 [Comamonas sp.]
MGREVGRDAPLDTALSAELVAVLVAVTQGHARILTTRDGQALPSGPFESTHRSLQSGMRAWVESQTHHPIGYIEQLYTFADGDRAALGERVISVSYLGLTRESAPTSTLTPTHDTPATQADGRAQWRDWYRYFPWEDQRQPQAQALLAQYLVPALQAWSQAAPEAGTRQRRRMRIDTAFGLQGAGWNEDFILQRYELLYEAGLVAEAARTPGPAAALASPWSGQPMARDFRRILATGIARLRAKIKYRPVVFELMPDQFTLLQLQQSIEVLAGRGLHKQNFRRLVEQQALVEETGAFASGSSGRPAKLFRFRDGVLLERAISGSKLPVVP